MKEGASSGNLIDVTGQIRSNEFLASQANEPGGVHPPFLLSLNRSGITVPWWLAAAAGLIGLFLLAMVYLLGVANGAAHWRELFGGNP